MWIKPDRKRIVNSEHLNDIFYEQWGEDSEWGVLSSSRNNGSRVTLSDVLPAIVCYALIECIIEAMGDDLPTFDIETEVVSMVFGDESLDIPEEDMDSLYRMYGPDAQAFEDPEP